MTNLLDDEHVGGIVLNGRDVSERKAFEAQLTHQAFHDASPGSPTARCSPSACATRSPARGARSRGCRGALPRPRRLQDDQRQPRPRRRRRGAASRSPAGSTRASAAPTPPRASAATSSPCCSRTSTSSQEAADTAERILEALADAAAWPATRRSRCAAASASRSPAADGTADADEMIRDADAAMYIAKRDGKGGYRAVRAGDARGRARAPRAAHRPAARDRHASQLELVLPAGRAARRRRGRRASRRCCAGATPSAGMVPPDAVHPDRRGDRARSCRSAAGCCARAAATPRACSPRSTAARRRR